MGKDIFKKTEIIVDVIGTLLDVSRIVDGDRIKQSDIEFYYKCLTIGEFPTYKEPSYSTKGTYDGEIVKHSPIDIINKHLVYLFKSDAILQLINDDILRQLCRVNQHGVEIIFFLPEIIYHSLDAKEKQRKDTILSFQKKLKNYSTCMCNKWNRMLMINTTIVSDLLNEEIYDIDNNLENRKGSLSHLFEYEIKKLNLFKNEIDSYNLLDECKPLLIKNFLFRKQLNESMFVNDKQNVTNSVLKFEDELYNDKKTESITNIYYRIIFSYFEHKPVFTFGDNKFFNNFRNIHIANNPEYYQKLERFICRAIRYELLEMDVESFILNLYRLKGKHISDRLKGKHISERAQIKIGLYELVKKIIKSHDLLFMNLMYEVLKYIILYKKNGKCFDSIPNLNNGKYQDLLIALSLYCNSPFLDEVRTIHTLIRRLNRVGKIYKKISNPNIIIKDLLNTANLLLNEYNKLRRDFKDYSFKFEKNEKVEYGNEKKFDFVKEKREFEKHHNGIYSSDDFAKEKKEELSYIACEIDKTFKRIIDLKEDEEYIANIIEEFEKKHIQFIKLVNTINKINDVSKVDSCSDICKIDDIEKNIISKIANQNNSSYTKDIKDNYKALKILEQNTSIAIKIDSFLRLKSFAPIDDMNFYVFSPFIRKRLKTTMEQIHQINKKEKDTDNYNKPICIFIPGAPGTGKTYFVKQFDRYLRSGDEDVCQMKNQIEHWKNYPATSLSGVSEENFYKSIRNHIDSVFNEERNRCPRTKIAFLDEVDTKAGNILSFRFLMDAMTGELSDEKGEFKKNHDTRNLIWFFAGSIGKTKESFIENFHRNDRKITDFFDRIHFDIELPSVERPGQSILNFLNALYREYDNKDNPKPDQFKRYIKIEKGVLYLFGATQWDSARQIKTVCRVATSKKTFNWNKPISLEDFRGITNSEEFVKTWKYLNDVSTCEKCKTKKTVDMCSACEQLKGGFGFNEVILVKFPKES